MTPISLDKGSSAEIAEVADLNFIVHASWAMKHTPGMRVIDKPDLVLTDSGLPSDTFNIVCRTRLPASQAPHRIREAIATFEQVGRPFSWWVGPADRPSELGALLVDAGLQRAETELAMAADLAALELFDLAPAGLEIHRVRTVKELQDFLRIFAGPAEREFYKRITPPLLAPGSPQWLYVGYVKGEPVATAELTVGGGVVGLYNIVTLEGYRRRGIGTAVTLQPLLHAREAGFHTAVLQAAAAGVGIYRRLGFRPFGDITEYKPPARHISQLDER